MSDKPTAEELSAIFEAGRAAYKQAKRSWDNPYYAARTDEGRERARAWEQGFSSFYARSPQ